MPDIKVCSTSELDHLGRKVVDIGGTEIGVFRLDDEFFAYENKCPHLEGPVCQGKILPLALEAVADDGTSRGRIFSRERVNVICPWHGYEFDIRTGKHPTDERIRLRRVPVRVSDGTVFVSVKDRA